MENYFIYELPSSNFEVEQGKDPWDAMERYLKKHPHPHYDGFEVSNPENIHAHYFVRSCVEGGEFDYFDLKDTETLEIVEDD